MAGFPKELNISQNLNTGDIEIGAVEIKNGTDDTRGTVGAVSTLTSASNGLPTAAFPAPALLSTNNTLQNAVSATGNGNALACSGYSAAVIEVTGTFTATVGVRYSRDGGTTYYAARMKDTSGNTYSTVSSTGIYVLVIPPGATHLQTPVTWTSGTSVTVVANLLPIYNDGLVHSTNMTTALGALIDKVGTREEKYSYTNITASTLIRTGAGQVKGIWVASTSSGTIKLWDNTSAATTVLINTTTPAAGTWIELGDAGFTTGLYATIANTLDCTIVWKDNTVA